MLLAGAFAPEARAAPGDVLIADSQAFGDLGGGIIRVDPVSGVRTTVSENAAPAGGPSFAGPTSLAVAPDGDLLVTDRGAFANVTDGVIRVDPLTGARSALSTNASPPDAPDFIDPFTIAIAGNGDVFVADASAFDGFGGRFRKKGRHSSATVRGTIWLTEERCDGTLTRVTKGVVSVRDLRAKRTVVVRAGGSYLARAQRAAAKPRRP